VDVLLKCLIVIQESERLTTLPQLETCCERRLTYNEVELF
jgi:hypothetical protein